MRMSKEFWGWFYRKGGLGPSFILSSSKQNTKSIIIIFDYNDLTDDTRSVTRFTECIKFIKLGV